jgi:hypothetical protein
MYNVKMKSHYYDYVGYVREVTEKANMELIGAYTNTYEEQYENINLEYEHNIIYIEDKKD